MNLQDFPQNADVIISHDRNLKAWRIVISMEAFLEGQVQDTTLDVVFPDADMDEALKLLKEKLEEVRQGVAKIGTVTKTPSN